MNMEKSSSGLFVCSDGTDVLKGDPLEGISSQFAVPRYVPARFSASTIFSTVISPGSKVTVLISLIPRNPFSTFVTPCNPSRAAFPTSYQAT